VTRLTALPTLHRCKRFVKLRVCIKRTAHGVPLFWVIPCVVGIYFLTCGIRYLYFVGETQTVIINYRGETISNVVRTATLPEAVWKITQQTDGTALCIFHCFRQFRYSLFFLTDKVEGGIHFFLSEVLRSTLIIRIKYYFVYGWTSKVLGVVLNPDCFVRSEYSRKRQSKKKKPLHCICGLPGKSNNSNPTRIPGNDVQL